MLKRKQKVQAPEQMEHAAIEPAVMQEEEPETEQDEGPAFTMSM